MKTEIETLLFITGSGNLTPTGWCDNFECFSVLELKPTKNHPNRIFNKRPSGLYF
jgi:hypothetical protein